MCTGDMFDSFANNWQVEQAYAQILTHPDVPSVYWKHYFDWGSDLQNKVKALINARKMVGDTTDGQPWKDRSVTFLKNHGTPQKDQVAGINAGSKVDFQENARYSGIYAARVTGRNGELYVRIGGSDQQWQPSASGYSDYREYARGAGWKVWVKFPEIRQYNRHPSAQGFQFRRIDQPTKSNHLRSRYFANSGLWAL